MTKVHAADATMNSFKEQSGTVAASKALQVGF